MIDYRAVRAPPTYARSVIDTGQSTIVVEVWANRARFRITLDRLLNLVSIQRFRAQRYYYWRLQWRRRITRGSRRKPLNPLHVDIVVCALEAAKAYATEKRQSKENQCA